jgi:ribokinase
VTVAVIGYASADRPVAVDVLPAPDTTAIVRERLGPAWPRLGGCGPQIAAGLAARGVDARCITWVADDEAGRYLRDRLEESGADVGGVDMGGQRTPESYLVYDRDGRTLCFFDPGGATPDRLTAAQREIVADAEVVCLSVAPAAVSRAALRLAGETARIVWSVKADPDAYPTDLAGELLGRAEVVWHSEKEATFLAGRVPGGSKRSDALVIETRGAAGAGWRRGSESGREGAEPVDVSDTTGAGDAFVAGSLTHLLDHPTDSAGAVRAGIAASRMLLESRASGEGELP